MCLILFSYKSHPNYPLILISNRDEFYARPTKRPFYWNDNPKILAGKDIKMAGTWMGITDSGKFAALTNYRDGTNKKEYNTSRGKIVSDYLTGEVSAEEYLTNLSDMADNFAGYNLLAGTIDNLTYYSYVLNSSESIKEGVHGLSNAYLNTMWPKVVKGRERLREAIKEDAENIDNYFRILRDKTSAPDSVLPSTGINKMLEKQLSPIFIRIPTYGTRSSAVMLISNNGKVQYYEQSYNFLGKRGKRLEYRFNLV